MSRSLKPAPMDSSRRELSKDPQDVLKIRPLPKVTSHSCQAIKFNKIQGGRKPVITRVVRNECECVNECEKMPPGKMNHNFFASTSFFNRKKPLES